VLPRFEVVEDWAYRVCDEFSQQVAEELALGLEPAEHLRGLDNMLSISRSQVFFVMYVVAPLWNAMSLLLPEFESARLCMERNKAKWKALWDAEEAKAKAKAAAEAPAPADAAEGGAAEAASDKTT